jgi:hypothetical protein
LHEKELAMVIETVFDGDSIASIFSWIRLIFQKLRGLAKWAQCTWH